MVKIEWLLDDDIFNLCDEFILFLRPYKKYFINSSSFLH